MTASDMYIRLACVFIVIGLIDFFKPEPFDALGAGLCFLFLALINRKG